MLRQTPNRRHRWLAPANSDLDSPHEPRPGHHPMEVYPQAGPTQVSLHNQAVEVLGDSQSSIAVPPVVEKSGNKYALIEGTARAVFCLKHRDEVEGNKTRCVVAEGVGEALPATAMPTALRYVLPVTRDPRISVDYKYFRHVERVAHPTDSLHESSR